MSYWKIISIDLGDLKLLKSIFWKIPLNYVFKRFKNRISTANLSHKNDFHAFKE